MQPVWRLWIAWCLLSMAARGVAAAAADEVLDGSTHLLLDSRVIERSGGVALRLGQVHKDSHNPLFGEDKPWEVRYDNLGPSVTFDEQRKQYQFWYVPFIVDPTTSTATDAIKKRMSYCQKMNNDHAVGKRKMAICYATSRDGIVWEKPTLGLCTYNGSTANNIVMKQYSGILGGVYRDRHETDPGRQFKMFAGTAVGFSADGIHWSEAIRCPEIGVAADTNNNAFWAEALGRYVGITRMWADGQRIVARTESPDFRRWSKGVEVLRGVDRFRQTYAMSAFSYAGVYLGLVMILNTRTDLVDCELAWSPDSVAWERICPGTPLIPHGSQGSCDSGCVWAAAPLPQDGKIRLYYGGNDGGHCSWRKGFLCLAWLRQDGFAGMQPTDAGTVGIVVTRPVRCAGKHLYVNTDAQNGSLRVEVLDCDGRGLQECSEIRGDGTRQPVRWSSHTDLTPLVGQPVRLKFELQRATLYSFTFAE